jgi:dipeptidyl-peptidase-4
VPISTNSQLDPARTRSPWDPAHTSTWTRSRTSRHLTTLYSGEGRELGVYREADRRIVDQYQVLPTELLSFKGPDGSLFYSRLIRPAGFDAAKKYPAIVLVYGGPGAQGVRNAWGVVDLDQVFAHAGFVVWQMDNRGSTGRGHAFETPIFRKLGPVELADQVAGVEQLISLGFVDPVRIGVRGWSYGDHDSQRDVECPRRVQSRNRWSARNGLA